MKKICLAVLFAFYALFCHAQITQVKDMEEVFQYFHDADSTTLAIFDVDMVLVQPGDPAFQMANLKRFSAISKSIMQEIPLDKQMIFLSLMTINSDSVLIDERTPAFLQQLHRRGIPTIALTANLTGKLGPIENMERWRLEELRKLEIDFSIMAPCQTPLVFDDLSSYRGNYATYDRGVLFANGTTVTKGDVFLSFLKKVSFSPTRIIFIDDREENLKSLEAAIQKLDQHIEYHGLHFLGAQKYPSKMISEEEFIAKWRKLASQAIELN